MHGFSMEGFYGFVHDLDWLGVAWCGVGLLLVDLLPIVVLRRVRQKVPFQVAWSAEIGGMLQIAIYVVAIGIVQRMHVLPRWMGYEFQMGALILGVLGGAIWTYIDRKTEWADLYHHLVVVPQQVFLFIVFLTVVFWFGTPAELISVGIFFGILVGLFVIDGLEGTFAQIVWILKQTGVWLGDRQKDPPEELKHYLTSANPR
jgi:hypothetical protein